MGKKKTASKSQATFVDEESSLSLIENQEFVAMRAAQKVWPAPTTSEDQLRELISDGLIQSKVIAEWRVPGEHWVPAPGPGEIVLFVSFVRVGLCLPAVSEFSANNPPLAVSCLSLCLGTLCTLAASIFA